MLSIGRTVHLHPALVLPEHLFTVDVYVGPNHIGDEGCWWLTQPKGRGGQPFSNDLLQGNTIINKVPLLKLEGSRMRVLNLCK